VFEQLLQLHHRRLPRLALGLDVALLRQLADLQGDLRLARALGVEADLEARALVP